MPVRIGIIGCGAITRRAYLPGFAKPGSPEALKANPYYESGGCEDAEVVALASRDVGRARSLADEFHVARVYEDWRELVRDPNVDAVCVNTPNNLHAEMTIAAANAGKHVLVEKPMAATIREADAMIEAAHRNRVFLMVDQTQRFWPAHEVAASIVQAGMLGRVHSIRGKMAHGGPQLWSPGSAWFTTKSGSVHGAMFDMGVHKLDLMRFILRSAVTEVAAFTDTFRAGMEVEDNAVAIFRFESGAMGVLEASWTCNPRENSTYVYGEHGNLRLGHTPEEPIFVELGLPASALIRDIPPGKTVAGRYVPDVPKHSRFGGPWRHFVESIARGVQPTPSGEDGRDSLEAVLAAFKSSEERSVVRLPLQR